jgi:hypothetical protein
MEAIDLRHSRLFSGRSEENQEKLQSGYLVSRQVFEPSTSRIQGWATSLRHIQMHMQSITENYARNGTMKRAYGLWVFPI